MQIFSLVIIFFAMLFLVLNLVLVWSIGKISGRYFDAKLHQLGQPLPIVVRICCSGPSARATSYYACILGNSMKSKYIPKKMKHNYLNNFGNIDYRALARKRDWIMAFFFWGSAVCFLLCWIVLAIMGACL